MITMPSLATLFSHLGDQTPVARTDEGRTVTGARLRHDVAALSGALAACPAHDWAVFYYHGYPALVALLALWQSGKTAWLPGDNLPGTAAALTQAGCRRRLGDWHGVTPSLAPATPAALKDCDTTTGIVIFTSGSSGHPKAIRKQWYQLLNELNTLETAFGATLNAVAGDQPGRPLFVGTVSHQHIYGLLFRLLWPLASGRELLSAPLREDSGVLRLATGTQVVWVASPAHLRRLHRDAPWHASELAAVFCSGGPLPADAADRLRTLAGQDAIEVYGSSETGGVAWRRQHDDDAWTPLPGINLTIGADGTASLDSPHLPAGQCYTLDDQLQPLAASRFRLAGRRDRILKVEGKRVSSEAVVNRLLEHPMIVEARVLQPCGEQRLGAVLVLTPDGRERLARDGRTALARCWREHLAGAVEPMAVPRRWRYPLKLPETAQGKVPLTALEALFSSSEIRLPRLGEPSRHGDHHVSMTLDITDDLPWFAGHFPQQSVVPGVVQIDWAHTCGRLFFTLPEPPFHLEAVKFHTLITPGTRLTLALDWQPERDRLVFSFHSPAGVHSRGRLVFAGLT